MAAGLVASIREERLPDMQGLYGENQRLATKGEFWSHHHRPWVDRLVVGIVLKNDGEVAASLAAIEYAFARQKEDGRVGDRGNTSTLFWAASVMPALCLLAESEYEPQFRPRIVALKRPVERMLDHLMLPASQEALASKRGRELYNADAFGFGSLFVHDSAPQEKRQVWRAEADRWIRLAFVEQKVYRELDGVLLQQGQLDTGAHAEAMATALRFFFHHAESVPGWEEKMRASARWLITGRLLPTGEIDCSAKVNGADATGTTGVEPEAPRKEARVDLRALRRGLLYWGALADREEALAALAHLGRAVSAQPPRVFSPLLARGKVGQPFLYTVLATNSPGPGDIRAEKLPAGLTLAPDQVVTGTTSALIKGIPSAPGKFDVPLLASNPFGTTLAEVAIIIDP